MVRIHDAGSVKGFRLPGFPKIMCYSTDMWKFRVTNSDLFGHLPAPF